MQSLPVDRHEAMKAVLDVIRQNLPPGYEEVLAWGMISWQVPLAVYPDTYNKQPLMYAALASQKNHMALHLCNVYGVPELRAGFERSYQEAGKRLDMGKSCVRFKKLGDVSLGAVAGVIAATPMADYVAFAKAVRAESRSGK